MMNRHRLYFLLLLSVMVFTSTILSAQIGMGSRSSGLNHAVTALDNHDWSIFANPATVSETKNQASFYYVRYYGLSSLSDVALSLSYPLKWGVLSAGLHSYGDKLYSETDIQLAWMMKFQTLKTALRLHYDHIAFGGVYGSAGTVGLDFGLLFPLAESVDLGATATNINRPQIGIDGQDRPRLITVGLAFKPIDKGLILVDVVKDVRYPISTRLGIEYPLIDALVLRAGVGNEPINTTFGAGITIGKWNVNLSAERHQELGWSPGIDVGFTW